MTDIQPGDSFRMSRSTCCDGPLSRRFADRPALALTDCHLLAPCEPSKIVAVGKNYHDHIKEFDSQVPLTPILFIKPSTSVLDPGAPIILPDPAISQHVDYEGELALVIGKTARHIRADEAQDYILGYTCLNDVTARDLLKKDGQWTRAKSFDTFAPMARSCPMRSTWLP